jgi:hypothetical protein
MHQPGFVTITRVERQPLHVGFDGCQPPETIPRMYRLVHGCRIAPTLTAGSRFCAVWPEHLTCTAVFHQIPYLQFTKPIYTQILHSHILPNPSFIIHYLNFHLQRQEPKQSTQTPRSPTPPQNIILFKSQI